ncbi:MAG: alpha/beta fold hydrolase [Candidatus Dormibacteria bacterium]
MLPAIHDTGSGEAVLFLHAFTMDASQWDHQVAALSGGLRCVRLDVWGCGESPAPPAGVPTLDGFATAVLAALDSRNIDRVAVVGLSMGGYLAFALWRLAPARIRALVLCNTRATADAEAPRNDRLTMADQVEREGSVESIVEPMVARLLSPTAQAEAHIVDPVRGRIRRCTPAGIAFAQRAMAVRPDSSALLASINVPTLVIAGTQDAIIPISEVQAMADSIPQARCVALDSGHMSNLELPRAVNEQLAGFLIPATMAP